MPTPTLAHAFTYTVRVTAPPHFLGVFPDGIRLLFHSPAGELVGQGAFAGFRATSLPQAADVFVIQPDDTGAFEVLASLETEDGKVFAEKHRGRATLPPGTYQAMLAGKPPSGTASARVLFEFMSGHAEHQALCRDVFFGLASLSFDTLTVHWDIYAAPA